MSRLQNSLFVLVMVMSMESVTATVASADQAFNGNTTFNGNVWMQGPEPWVDVKAYGAKGDGSTNDAGAIQNAINSLPFAGGTVFFPGGSYYVHSTVTISTSQVNVVLRGAGAGGWGNSPQGTSELITDQEINILQVGGTSSTSLGGPRIYNLGFRDISSSGVALGAIQMNRIRHFLLEDVNCGEFTNGYCVTLDGTNDFVEYGDFIKLNARDVKTGVRMVNGVGQITFYGGHITSSLVSGSIGLDLEGEPGSGRIGNVVVYNTALESFSIGIKAYNTQLCRFQVKIENTGDSSYHTGTGILIDSTDADDARSNSVMGSSIDGPAIGIQVNPNAAESSIMGNTIVDTPTANISNSGQGTLILAQNRLEPGSAAWADNVTHSGSGAQASWTTGSGSPGGSCVTGSLYTNTNSSATSVLYVCQNGNWVGK